jgi:hypothetical protein
VTEKRQPITEARLEAALLQSAEIADRLPEARPIYDALEAALLDRRSKDPQVRARSLLRSSADLVAAE